MPGDPKECRERAKGLWALASEGTNPALKESLLETAQRWSHLATDLETMYVLQDQWRQEDAIEGK